MPPVEGSTSTADKRRQRIGAVVVLILALVATLFVAQRIMSAPSGEANASSSQGVVNSAGVVTPTALDDPSVLRDTRVDPHNTDHPAVKYMNPQLRKAVQKAKAAAKEEGIANFWLTSGWRTASYQQELLNSAVKKRGSESAARKWVKSPRDSEHVHGDAADIGPTAAAYWMDQNAGRFGLCRTYANEVWHYELNPSGSRECPAMKENAAG